MGSRMVRTTCRWAGVLLASTLLAFAPLTALAEPANAIPTAGEWVTAVEAGNFWSGPDGAAIAFGPVAPGQPLRVERTTGERVLVQNPGNGLGGSGGPAWVDRSSVRLTDDPRYWFGPADPQAGVELWSGSDANAVRFGVAGPERPLAWAGKPVGDRLPVMVADDKPGLAWVDVDAIAPIRAPDANSPAVRAAKQLAPVFPRPVPPPPLALAPAMKQLPPATSTPPQPPVTQAERDKFIAEWGERGRRLRAQTGLPPSLVVAIAINETGWGRSRLAQEANNYFGLKTGKRPGSAGSISLTTWEVVDGKDVQVQESFRKFNAPEESLLDLVVQLRANPRYNPIWSMNGDMVAMARGMLAAGYATDPTWADKLAKIRTTYDLARFD